MSGNCLTPRAVLAKVDRSAGDGTSATAGEQASKRTLNVQRPSRLCTKVVSERASVKQRLRARCADTTAHVRTHRPEARRKQARQSRPGAGQKQARSAETTALVHRSSYLNGGQQTETTQQVRKLNFDPKRPSETFI